MALHWVSLTQIISRTEQDQTTRMCQDDLALHFTENKFIVSECKMGVNKFPYQSDLETPAKDKPFPNDKF